MPTCDRGVVRAPPRLRSIELLSFRVAFVLRSIVLQLLLRVLAPTVSSDRSPRLLLQLRQMCFGNPGLPWIGAARGTGRV